MDHGYKNKFKKSRAVTNGVYLSKLQHPQEILSILICENLSKEDMLKECKIQLQNKCGFFEDFLTSKGLLLIVFLILVKYL